MCSLVSSIVVVVLGLGGVAGAAGAPIHVELTGEEVFAREELVAAIAARGPLASERSPGVVVVVAVEGDEASISVGERRRTIALGERRGGAAARLVAIAAHDLVAPLPAMPATDVRRRGTDVSTWAVAAGSFGALEPASLGVAIDLSVPLTSHWRAAATLQATWTGEVEPGFSMTSFTLRPAVGLRLGLAELRLGPSLTRYAVDGGTGHASFLLGAGATVLLRARVLGGASVMVAAGGDLYAQRASFASTGAPFLSTPRVWLWGGAGLGWEWGR